MWRMAWFKIIQRVIPEIVINLYRQTLKKRANKRRKMRADPKQNCNHRRYNSSTSETTAWNIRVIIMFSWSSDNKPITDCILKCNNTAYNSVTLVKLCKTQKMSSWTYCQFWIVWNFWGANETHLCSIFCSCYYL